MDYVRLGRAGLKVSRLGLGAMGFGDRSWRSWVLDLDQSRAVFRRAIEAGINFIDTCDYYSNGVSEEIVGALVAEHGNRAELVIATKVGNPMGRGPNARGFSRKHIIEAAEASLRRLRVECIDLYQTHIWDPATNLEEMVEAFDHLVRIGQGAVRGHHRHAVLAVRNSVFPRRAAWPRPLRIGAEPLQSAVARR